MTNPHAWAAPLVWLASFGLLALMATAAVAQGPPSTTPSPSHPTGSPTAPPSGAPNQTQSPGATPPAPDQARRPNETPAQQPGRLLLSDGSADGRYVDFSFDAAAGTLSGYTVGETEWFSQIQAPGSFEAKAHGAYVSLKGDGFVLSVTDNPTGLLRIQANNTTIQLSLASGVAATANGSRVDLAAGNDSAFVTNATLAGSSLTMKQGVFLLRGPSVSAVARAYAPSQAQIEDAIAQGRVAARVQVLPGGADVLDFQGAQVEARANANGSHRVIVDANFTSGRTFVVDFAPGLLKAEELGVLYYDEVNGTLQPAMIQRADSLDDVLLIEAGEGPEHWHVDDLQGEQVLVAIPHFSVHAFDVYAISGEVAPMILIGLVGAIVLVAVLAVGAYVGRRE